MKLKQYIWLGVFLIACSISILPAYSHRILPRFPGFQVSTIGALNAGVFQGALTLGELKQHGNFGLGTFEGLDGEMIATGGKFYQMKFDGVAHPVADEIKTPFAVVTFFRSEKSLRLPSRMTYQELQQAIDEKLSTKNLPYAIRMRGTFPYLKFRSVAKQTLPYPTLNDAISRQNKFERRNVLGTLVGFRLPQYLKGANVEGYHFHFIADDRSSGGHLLDGEFLNPVVEIETLRDWQMALPNNDAFLQAAL